MYPVSLNLASIPILLIGEGEAFAKRKAQLLACGACHLTCHSYSSPHRGEVRRGTGLLGDNNSDTSVQASPHPNPPPMGEGAVVMVAGLDHSASEMIANEARKQKKLVNVEDVPELCDFYFTSFVTRGDLTIAVSTNGASPTLAKRVRDKIAGMFGVEWVGYTQETKALRDKLRGEGKSMGEVMVETNKVIDQLFTPHLHISTSPHPQGSLGYARDKVL